MSDWKVVPDLNKPDNNPKMKILFVVLLLALIGELVYLIQFQKKRPISFLFIPSPTPYVFSTPTPGLPTPTEEPNPISTTISPNEKPNMITLLGYQGKIVKIDINKVNHTLDSNNVVFSFVIKVKDESAINIPKIFSFDSNALNHIKVTNSKGDIISYNDLIVGKNIEINENYGSIKKPFYSFEITVLD